MFCMDGIERSWCWLCGSRFLWGGMTMMRTVAIPIVSAKRFTMSSMRDYIVSLRSNRSRRPLVGGWTVHSSTSSDSIVLLWLAVQHGRVGCPVTNHAVARTTGRIESRLLQPKRCRRSLWERKRQEETTDAQPESNQMSQQGPQFDTNSYTSALPYSFLIDRARVTLPKQYTTPHHTTAH